MYKKTMKAERRIRLIGVKIGILEKMLGFFVRVALCAIFGLV